MFIVCEGADGVGKSTFINSLVEQIEASERESGSQRAVRVFHHGKPQGHPLDEYEKDYQDYDPKGDHVICDRLHWGEAIYGPLYRGDSNMTAAQWLHIDKFLESHGAVMVHLDNEPDVLRARYAERGEDFLQDEHIEHVLECYRLMARTSCLDVKTLVDPGRNEVIGIAILGYIGEHHADELREFPTYVGPRYPKFLLLGERRKEPSYKKAFVPHRTTSGAFLLEALPIEVALKTGIANACEEDVHKLWEVLGNPKVVTLGKDAHRVLNIEKIEHETVPHPQYVRRFHNKLQTSYGQAISYALHGEPVPFPPKDS